MTPPQLEELAPFQLWDKAEHFLAFFAGAINLTLALCWNTRWPWKQLIIFSVIALSVFGAVDEIHQLFTPNRSGADPYDWSADTLGALTGTLLTFLIYVRNFRTRRPTPAGA
jgi:VanZ family protein